MEYQMNLRELELLHSLMTHGSVSDAARSLHMSQPNASKLLKKLENRFGFQLFERINSRLHTTEEARLLFDQVERTLLSMRRFHAMTEEVRDMHRGSLTVGGLPLLSRYWLPDVVGEFMAARPGISMTFHTRSSKKLIEWVGERQIDIALGMLSADDPTVDRSTLIEMQFVAAVPLDHPLAARDQVHAEDLHGQPFIALSELDHSRDDIDRALRQAGVQPRERVGCSLPSVAIQLVEKGLGITLLDHVTALEHVPRNVVFKRFSPLIRRNIWILRPRMRPRSRLADEFVALLHDTVRADRLSEQPDRLFS
jgi:DNA-binding transcriptional LysR family regulator